MDVSRMTERLLRLAVSARSVSHGRSPQCLSGRFSLSLCFRWRVSLLFTLTSPRPVSSSRFRTICSGWCFSIGSSTRPWTSQLSCSALETESSTRTGGMFCLCLTGSVCSRNTWKPLASYFMHIHKWSGTDSTVLWHSSCPLSDLWRHSMACRTARCKRSFLRVTHLQCILRLKSDLVD